MKSTPICGHERLNEQHLIALSHERYKPSTVILLASKLYNLSLSHAEAVELMHLPATRHLPITEIIFKLAVVESKVQG